MTFAAYIALSARLRFGNTARDDPHARGPRRDERVTFRSESNIILHAGNESAITRLATLFIHHVAGGLITARARIILSAVKSLRFFRDATILAPSSRDFRPMRATPALDNSRPSKQILPAYLLVVETEMSRRVGFIRHRFCFDASYPDP